MRVSKVEKNKENSIRYNKKQKKAFDIFMLDTKKFRKSLSRCRTKANYLVHVAKVEV